jgi:GNAT superfamily N-acetyltransferase
MDGNNVQILVAEMTRISDFLKYVGIVIKDGKWTWLNWIFLMATFGHKKCKWFAVKEEGNLIGGFAIADYPVAKYKPLNWFNFKFREKVDELMKKGFQGFCCFVISPEYQNKGIGSLVWDSYFKTHHLKLFFTATKKAVPFYLRHGAKAFYPDRYTIYTYEN